jgi:peptidase E
MKQIIAIGGAGLSHDPDKLALERYIIEQSGKPSPSVCFIPTASGEADDYVINFYATFSQLGCKPSHLSLFQPPSADLASFLLKNDIIYVGGGNTRSMLALWREWDIDKILHQAWNQDIVLAGVSAGAICWFEQGVTDSIPGRLVTLDCMGFLPNSCCPHYDSEKNRRPTYLRLLLENKIMPGYAVEDGVALHFVDQTLKHVVSSRPNARAYNVEMIEDKAAEQPLDTIHLFD